MKSMQTDHTPPFKIWIDADACPRPVKEMLYRAAERKKIPLVLVANVMLNLPTSPWISGLQVKKACTAPMTQLWPWFSPAIW